MKKRILPVLLSLALCLSLLPGALAVPAGPVSEAEAAQVLAALGIMTGDPDGGLRLDDTITRAELITMAVVGSAYKDSVGDTASVKPYPDVPREEWYAPYVELARDKGLVGGYTDGTFRPQANITLAETATIVLNLLGYQASDFSGQWPTGQMSVFRSLNLDTGVTASQDQPIVRRDALYIFYNLLTAKNKMGQTYLTTLGHALTSAGEIDRVALINATMEGPALAGGDWQARLGISPITVYRSGKLSSPANLQPEDVIYWSKSMRTVWAYSDKVTGLYQAASPSVSAPKTVTVAGRSYSIETADAAYALSSLGQFRVGDPVTLLLGRDGGVAAVLSPAETSSPVCGVVTAVSEERYTDPSGAAYTAKTLSLTASDGSARSYPVSPTADWKAGDLVQVSPSGSEYAVSRLRSSSVSGQVDAAGTRVGSTPFADNVEILDVKGAQALRVWPARLAGARLEESHVKFCRKNAAGEIDVLILNNFTGDLYSYGVLTSANESEMPSMTGGLSSLMGTYTYDVHGTSYTYVLQNSHFNQPEGPVRIEGSLMAPASMRRLTGVRLTLATALSAVTETGTTLPVWESVTVYQLQNGTYRLSSLERAGSARTLTGYYDALPQQGGRIRIIVFQN